jgi:ABC-2 type transport system ATP-binding protein
MTAGATVPGPRTVPAGETCGPNRTATERGGSIAVEAHELSRSFGGKAALSDVSLRVSEGEIHALIGPNGAGKTTLLRIVAGLVTPDGGRLVVLGREATATDRAARGAIGLVPAGERSFYLRISGLENLVFFARLHGLRRGAAVERSLEALEAVGLLPAARTRAGEYSHGMLRRLAVARAILTRPRVLLMDEATHDLDPHGADAVRQLAADAARKGAAVLWATQRLDEIRGFTTSVTLLDHGRSRFAGGVHELMAFASRRRYALELRHARGGDALADASRALGESADLAPLPGDGQGHFVLALRDGIVLGHALAQVSLAGVDVLSCREERSALEDAFRELTGGARA